MISKVLEKDSEKRATLDQILEHPWVTKNGQECIDIKCGGHEFGEIDRACMKYKTFKITKKKSNIAQFDSDNMSLD